MSDEPSILVLHPGQIKAAVRKALAAAGVLVIEVDDPASVRFMRPNAELSSTEMLVAALRAIKRHGSSGYLGEEIIAAVVSKYPRPEPPK